MRSPMARLKFSISTSVFFTSDEYTSEPTMGQKGTCAGWRRRKASMAIVSYVWVLMNRRRALAARQQSFDRMHSKRYAQ